MAVWRDETSYRRGEARVPRTWACPLTGGLRLVVHRRGGTGEAGGWSVSLHPVWEDHVLLHAADAEEAQATALRLAAEWLEAALVDARSALEASGD